MIVTEIYNGQGLGNQLYCYVSLRTLSLDLGYDYGIMNPHKFKCLDFMDLDMGLPVVGGSSPHEGAPPTVLPNNILYFYAEKQTEGPGCLITLEDNELKNLKDCTKLDGLLQSENYFLHIKDEIKKWLKVRPEFDCYDFSDDNICIINFRGGEYVGLRDVYLTRNYWTKAVNNMLNINKDLKFIVVTDDVNSAKQMLPEYEVYHWNIAKDYSVIKNAKYAILSNSTFSFFPIWTSDTIKVVISPKYNSRHNISDGYWSLGYNIYRNWLYMDSNGGLFTYEQCIKEFEEYRIKNKLMWL